MNARDGQGRTGQGRAKRAGRGRVIAKGQDPRLSRKRRERPTDRADSDMRAVLWIPLLDTELLSLDIHRSWR